MHPTQNPAEVTETPAITLRCAALYIRRYGWTQDDYYDRYTLPGQAFPPACALGAIAAAVYGEALPHPEDETRPGYPALARARDALGDYIDPEEYGCGQGSAVIGDWNDEPGRTADDVVSVLNEAANQWDRQHPGGVR